MDAYAAIVVGVSRAGPQAGFRAGPYEVTR